LASFRLNFAAISSIKATLSDSLDWANFVKSDCSWFDCCQIIALGSEPKELR
jgi:hypothetical protein